MGVVMKFTSMSGVKATHQNSDKLPKFVEMEFEVKLPSDEGIASFGVVDLQFSIRSIETFPKSKRPMLVCVTNGLSSIGLTVRIANVGYDAWSNHCPESFLTSLKEKREWVYTVHSVEEQVEGQVEGEVEGQVEGQVEGRVERRVERRVDRQVGLKLVAQSEVGCTHQQLNGPTKFVEIKVPIFVEREVAVKLASKFKDGIVASFTKIKCTKEDDNNCGYLLGISGGLAKSLGLPRDLFSVYYDEWSNHGSEMFVKSLERPRRWSLIVQK